MMFNCVASDSRIRQVQDFGGLNPLKQRSSVSIDQRPEKTKSTPIVNPGCLCPGPTVELVALSPDNLLSVHKVFCEICHKGFIREQNLQLHKRHHNLPWKLKQEETGKEMKRSKRYICPEPTCIRHNPLKAIGDLAGMKKHFLRKHYIGDKKWKCKKCSKLYAVKADCTAHSKKCGTNVSRKESFLSDTIHSDTLVEEHVEHFTHDFLGMMEKRDRENVDRGEGRGSAEVLDNLRVV